MHLPLVNTKSGPHFSIMLHRSASFFVAALYERRIQSGYNKDGAYRPPLQNKSDGRSSHENIKEPNDHEKQTSLSIFVRRLRGWTTLDALDNANFRAAQSARAASGSKPGPTRAAESSSTDPAEPCATSSAKP